MLSFSPYEGSTNTHIIKEVNCRVTIGSAEAPDGARGEHTSMAHCSEVGLWKKTEGKTPEDIVQSVCSGILDVPFSMIVYESTAKGVGNYFHDEWVRAIDKKSNFDPVFIAWNDIDMYAIPVNNYKQFIDSLSDYEKLLWEDTGATLEQINWYRYKLKDQKDEWRMKSEFPSFADEAFQSTGSCVFDVRHISRLRKSCIEPMFIGEISAKSSMGLESMIDIRLEEKTEGRLKVWQKPDTDTKMVRRYAVSVDIGGRSKKADFSVITVLDRYYMSEDFGVPEIVAQWRGHTDHDLLAWLGVTIATYYGNALLIYESNTYEAEGTEGEHGEYILEEVSGSYDNLYTRTSEQKIRLGLPSKWGFQTNRQTKTKLIDNYVRCLREDGYIERDKEACHELQKYEVKQNGTYGAITGGHDDIVMSRAIGLYACYDFQNFPMPAIIVERPVEKKVKRINTAADF